MRNKLKGRSIILIAVVAMIIVVGVASIIFFQFTNIGFCMTIRLRNFTEVEHHIFINNNGSICENEAIEAVNEARHRVADLFGEELQSDPVIIFSDNPRTYRRTGEATVYTFTLHRVFSYISISHRNLNADIIAHEITHAELHFRLINGRMFRFENYIRNTIPLWFDEGLSSIPDHREMFSREVWERKIVHAGYVADVTMFPATEFRDDRAMDSPLFALHITNNFLLARHEVMAWIEYNGTEGLLRLIDAVRDGADFAEIYFATRPPTRYPTALADWRFIRRDTTADANSGRPVGVFVTTEPLDLQPNQHRIYAELVDMSYKIELAGDTVAIEWQSYVFTGINGIPFFWFTQPGLDHVEFVIDEAVGHLYSRELSSTEAQLSGTIFFELGSIIDFYVHEVRQLPNGKVFLNPHKDTPYQTADITREGGGVGLSWGSPLKLPGTLIPGSTPIPSSHDDLGIMILFRAMYLPEKIVVAQMDVNHSLIASTAFAPYEFPAEVFEPEPGTAYLVVETHTQISNGEMRITREIFSRGESWEYFTHFELRPNGILQRVFSYGELVWH